MTSSQTPQQGPPQGLAALIRCQIDEVLTPLVSQWALLGNGLHCNNHKGTPQEQGRTEM